MNASSADAAWTLPALEGAATASAAARELPDLMTFSQEGSSLGRLRRRLLRALLWQKLRTARLRLTLIVGLSIFFWIGLYVLFYEGFLFLEKFPDFKPSILNTYFSALMLMLMISTGLITYSGLYRSDETRFLLTLPLRGESIFLHKFQEAIWFGGWGFLLTSTPLLAAAGVTAGAPWLYYALLLPFLLSFIYIPAGLGALFCVVVVRWLPRRRMQFLGVGIACLVAFLIWISWSALAVGQRDFLSRTWWQSLSDRLQYTEQRFLPSYWLSAGLLEAEYVSTADEIGYNPWSESLLYLGVLVSNALMVRLLATSCGGPLFRTSYQRLQVESFGRNRAVAASGTTAREPWGAARLFFMFPPQLRVLLAKEWRIFHRDPVQWLQFVLFFGLLVLYLVNLQRFPYEREYSAMIGYLNLAVVGLILSTFTTRFIYPMISLEGKRFWILNLLPIERGVILQAKFLFAALGSWLPCASLILLSDLMLSLPEWMIWLHQLACAELCWGLGGLAVGLGGMIPDMREESPSKIAAGFGGTLNLVLSAAYILVIVLVAAVPCQMRIIQERGLWQFPSSPWLTWVGSTEAIATSQIINLALAFLATYGAMRMGIRSFAKQDF